MTVAPIIVHILGDTAELEASLATAGGAIKGFGAALMGIGTGLTALLTVPIVGIGAAALLSANNVQKAYAIIIAGTGATGSKLDGLEKQFDSLAASVPNSFTDTATVLTTVNEKLGSMGVNVVDISHKILDVSRMTGESATTLSSDFTAAIYQWKDQIKNVDDFMNEVYSTAQEARVPVTTILTDLDRYGPVIRSANIPLQTAIPIIGEIEAKGEDATRTFQGMAYAWANTAKMIASPSKTTQATVDAITESAAKAGIQLTSTGNDLQAVFYGIKSGIITDAEAANIFGPRFADNIDSMIRDGTISGEDFIKMTSGMSMNIDDVGHRTITFAQSLDIVRNAFEIAIDPLGAKMIAVFQQMLPAVMGAIGVLGRLMDVFAGLPLPVADVVMAIAAFAAGIGPVLVGTSALISAVGNIVNGFSRLINIASTGASALSNFFSAGSATTATASIVAETGAIDDETVAASACAVSEGELAIQREAATAAVVEATSATIAETVAEDDLTASIVANALSDETLIGSNTVLAGSADLAGASLITEGAAADEAALSEDALAVSAGVADVAVGTGLVGALVSLLVTLGTIAAVLAPIVLLIGTLAAGFIMAYETSSTLRDTIATVGGVFVTFGGQLMEGIGLIIHGDYKSGFADFQKAFTDLWKGLVVIDWDHIGEQIDTEIKDGIANHKGEIMHALDGFEAEAIKFFQGVNWESVGTVVGQALGTMLAIALNGAMTALGSAAQGPGQVTAPPGFTQTVSPSDVTAQNLKLAQGTSGLAYNAQGQLTGAMQTTDMTTQLEQVGEAAAGAFVRGFEKGFTDGLKKVRWGDLLWGIINTDLSTGQQTQWGFDPGNSPLKHWIDDIGSWWDHINWGQIFNFNNIQSALTSGLAGLASGVGHLFDPIMTPINNFVSWWNGLHFGPIALPQITLPDLNPIHILEEALHAITNIPNDVIDLTVNLGGVAISVLQELQGILDWIVRHFSTHEIELDIKIPGMDMLEKVYGDLMYIVNHSAIVTTLKTEADSLITKWNDLGISGKFGPWSIGGETIPSVGWGGFDIPSVGWPGFDIPSVGWGGFTIPPVGWGGFTIPPVGWDGFTIPSVGWNGYNWGGYDWPGFHGGGGSVGGGSIGGGSWTVGPYTAGFTLAGQNLSATVGPWTWDLPSVPVPTIPIPNIDIGGFDVGAINIGGFQTGTHQVQGWNTGTHQVQGWNTGTHQVQGWSTGDHPVKGWSTGEHHVQGWNTGEHTVPKVVVEEDYSWKAPQIPLLAGGAIIGARRGGVPVLAAEAGKPELFIPWDRVGEDWGNLLSTLPRLAGGAIVGAMSPPYISGGGTGTAQREERIVNYQVNVTADGEQIQREVFAAIRQLEDFHHL
jgi:hypothetical protein